MFHINGFHVTPVKTCSNMWIISFFGFRSFHGSLDVHTKTCAWSIPMRDLLRSTTREEKKPIQRNLHKQPNQPFSSSWSKRARQRRSADCISLVHANRISRESLLSVNLSCCTACRRTSYISPPQSIKHCSVKLACCRPNKHATMYGLRSDSFWILVVKVSAFGFLRCKNSRLVWLHLGVCLSLWRMQGVKVGPTKDAKHLYTGILMESRVNPNEAATMCASAVSESSSELEREEEWEDFCFLSFLVFVSFLTAIFLLFSFLSFLSPLRPIGLNWQALHTIRVCYPKPPDLDTETALRTQVRTELQTPSPIYIHTDKLTAVQQVAASESLFSSQLESSQRGGYKFKTVCIQLTFATHSMDFNIHACSWGYWSIGFDLLPPFVLAYAWAWKCSSSTWTYLLTLKVRI